MITKHLSQSGLNGILTVIGLVRMDGIWSVAKAVIRLFPTKFIGISLLALVSFVPANLEAQNRRGAVTPIAASRNVSATF